MYSKHSCCKNKGIRSCSQCSFLVTKVKILENKVFKTLFSKENLSNKTKPKIPKPYSLILLIKFINSLIINVWFQSSGHSIKNYQHFQI